MEGNIWTESAITAVQDSATQYINKSSWIVLALTLLVACGILRVAYSFTTPHSGGRRFSHVTICNFAMLQLVWERAPPIMYILIHTGLNIGGFQVVPQILPNTCELSRIVEGQDGQWTWPCSRDEVVEAWRSGKIKLSMLKDNMLFVLCWWVMFTIGFWVIYSLVRSWVDEWVRRNEQMQMESEEAAPWELADTKSLPEEEAGQ